jgi:predicted NBD/HSP70 family sugar kinase
MRCYQGCVTTTSWAGRPDASLTVAIEVLRHGPISRTDIAQRLALSTPSLTRLSRPLLERNLIKETGERVEGYVGRPRRLLDVDADARHFIGIKLRESEIIGALTNLRGAVVRRATTELADRSPEAVVAVMADLVEGLRGEYEVSGIGIGLGGVVRGRTVAHSPYLGWRDVDLADLVAARTGVPTLVDNDVVAFTEFVHWFGEGRDVERFAVVTLGVATGYGVVVNGNQIVNDDYGIGLVNHWPLDPTGPLCAEGHRGCAAAVLSSDAIAARTSQALGRAVGFDEVLQLAQDGQPAAAAVVEEAGRGLGRLLAAISNLTMPECLVIAGEGVQLAQVAKEKVVQQLEADRPAQATTPPLVLTNGDNIEWCRGAAVLAIQSFVRGTKL